MSGEQKTVGVVLREKLGDKYINEQAIRYAVYDAMQEYADQQNAALKEMIGDILASYEQYGELPSDIIDRAKKLIAENRE